MIWRSQRWQQSQLGNIQLFPDRAATQDAVTDAVDESANQTTSSFVNSQAATKTTLIQTPVPVIDRGNSHSDAFDGFENQDDVDLANSLIRQLKAMPERLHRHILHSRLMSILQFIRRNRATPAVEGELKYLAETDAERQHQSFAFVRILIWATPMLGFLGTVIGISHALGQLNVGADNDLQAMMSGLQSSLYVAFDTTAQALVLSMVMMFGMFFVEQTQTSLMFRIDQAAMDNIANSFEYSERMESGAPSDGPLMIKKLGRKLLASTRTAVKEHTRIWKKTIEAAENSWITVNSEMTHQSQRNIQDALKGSLSEWVSHMDETIQKADDSMAKRWGQWQTILSDNSRHLEKMQINNQRQVELLTEALEKMVAIVDKQNSPGIEASLIEMVSAVRLLKDETQQLRELTQSAKDASQLFQLKVARQTRQSA
jgi:biopolymer transport protein ExbB/TolQ